MSWVINYVRKLRCARRISVVHAKLNKPFTRILMTRNERDWHELCSNFKTRGTNSCVNTEEVRRNARKWGDITQRWMNMKINYTKVRQAINRYLISSSNDSSRFIKYIKLKFFDYFFYKKENLVSEYTFKLQLFIKILFATYS